MMRAEADISIGREMKHHVAVGNRGSQCVGVEQIRLDQTELRRPRCVFDEAALARGKIVEADDAVARGKEPIDQTAADEAGGTGDETSHTQASLFWGDDLKRAAGAAPRLEKHPKPIYEIIADGHDDRKRDEHGPVV